MKLFKTTTTTTTGSDLIIRIQAVRIERKMKEDAVTEWEKKGSFYFRRNAEILEAKLDRYKPKMFKCFKVHVRKHVLLLFNC